jgi:hypothetical protein
MSHFNQHREFYDKPIFLSGEEEKEPLLVIKEFFADYRLSEVRAIHEEIDIACLSCNVPPFDKEDERARLLYFRKQEERILEAALLLLQHGTRSTAPGGL